MTKTLHYYRKELVKRYSTGKNQTYKFVDYTLSVRLSWKWLTLTKTLAYYCTKLVTAVKSCIAQK